jgi:hypothetical protein
MDRVTRCLHCGKRMVPAPGLTGRTELICVYCGKTESIGMAEAKQPAEGPMAHPSVNESPGFVPGQPAAAQLSLRGLQAG